MLLVITGPTASGKSGWALEAALWLKARGFQPEILSADSAQVYRHMNIGTDKLPPAERRGIPHHLIDVVNPDEPFSAAQWATAARKELTRLFEQGQPAILVGGTGFYLRTLFRGLFPGPAANPELRARLEKEAERKGPSVLHDRLRQVDPVSADRIHPHDLIRIVRALEVYELTGEPLSRHFEHQPRHTLPRFRVWHFGLSLPRGELYRRINDRVERMFAKGLVSEVESLRAQGYGPHLRSQKIIGYRQVHAYLEGAYDLERAKELIQRDSRHYARRQLTWLRAEPEIRWLEAGEPDKVIQRLEEVIH